MVHSLLSRGQALRTHRWPGLRSAAGTRLKWSRKRAFSQDCHAPSAPLHPHASSGERSVRASGRRARGTYVGTTNRKEGVVVRPVREAHSPTLGGHLSFKVLNNDFLLAEG
jgi:hypothetical protein